MSHIDNEAVSYLRAKNWDALIKWSGFERIYVLNWKIGRSVRTETQENAILTHIFSNDF